MKPPPRALAFSLALGLALAASHATAESRTEEDLRRQIEALRAQVERLQASRGPDQALAELSRRIDLVAAEVDALRSGEGRSETTLEGHRGLAPAASKVYGVARGVSLGGYGEALYEDFAARREDGTDTNRSDRLDALRQVLYVGYKFSDRILFNSEIEFEHASTGEGAEERGEVSVEFGYLEFRPHAALGFRAGLLLVPVGFINELHEPPIFLGVHRPEVETDVIPATWSENGAGIFGEAGAFEWRTYLVAGLDSQGFGAAGIRNGRQEGSQSLARDFALTGRLDYRGVPGLVAGASLFVGNSGQGASVQGQTLRGRVSLVDLHAQYEMKGLHLRALAVRSSVADGALINQANGLTGSESVGTRQHGWYLEAAYDVMSLAPHGEWSVRPFARYECLDTQDGVPPGYARDPATRRRLLSFGVEVKPLTQVALKLDYTLRHDDARTGTNQMSLGIGYLF